MIFTDHSAAARHTVASTESCLQTTMLGPNLHDIPFISSKQISLQPTPQVKPKHQIWMACQPLRFDFPCRVITRASLVGHVRSPYLKRLRIWLNWLRRRSKGGRLRAVDTLDPDRRSCRWRLMSDTSKHVCRGGNKEETSGIIV